MTYSAPQRGLMRAGLHHVAFLSLCFFPICQPQAVGDQAEPGQHMFIFSSSFRSKGASAARLHFCVQDSHNSYCLTISPRRVAIQKIEKGRKRELVAAPVTLNSEGRGLPASTARRASADAPTPRALACWIEIQRKASEIVVAVNEKPICRFTMSIDQRFGLLGEEDRDCQIRDLTLTGQWPKTLPERLIE